MRCECGFDFTFDNQRAVRRDHAQWRSAARWRVVAGLGLMALGAMITIASYAGGGTRGGSYTIYVGLMFAGLVMSIHALVRLRQIRDIERQD